MGSRGTDFRVGVREEWRVMRRLKEGLMVREGGTGVGHFIILKWGFRVEWS